MTPKRESLEYAVEQLIPPWSTNPDLPAGQPYPGDVGRIYGPYSTMVAVDAFTEGWEPGTWRIMVRTVTEWRVDGQLAAAEKARKAAWRQERQQRTRQAAQQHYAHYTPDELAILADPTISNRQAAAAVGRSFYAVRTKRERMAGKR
jgi:hypothetical protein